MGADVIDAAAWQESWDRQQEAYLPGREERFGAMLDAVEVVADGRPPQILDLAGGTGSISLRVLGRFPEATTTLLDLDPVLLAIARASLPDRSTVVDADLRTPAWLAALPHRDFDAVLTSTALHWVAADRLAALYREIYDALRPGGVFINADHMPDDGLPDLNARLLARREARRLTRHAAGAVLNWRAWWDHVAADPVLGPLVARRTEVFGETPSAEFTPPLSWHVGALRDAGFTEVGIVWRGGGDAAVAAVR